MCRSHRATGLPVLERASVIREPYVALEHHTGFSPAWVGWGEVRRGNRSKDFTDIFTKKKYCIEIKRT